MFLLTAPVAGTFVESDVVRSLVFSSSEAGMFRSLWNEMVWARVFFLKIWENKGEEGVQNIYGKRLINTWWWCDDERKKIGTLPLCFPRGDSAKEKMLVGGVLTLEEA
jgi:hypothetical protein